jgi:hypothetical protein
LSLYEDLFIHALRGGSGGDWLYNNDIAFPLGLSYEYEAENNILEII